MPYPALWLFTLLLSLSACKETNEWDGDYLVFGSFADSCEGEGCIELFRLEPKVQKLFEDSRDNYPSPNQNYIGDFDIDRSDSFSDCEVLWTAFPDSLLQMGSAVIGCPDCVNQGGIYLEIKRGNFYGHWHIDRGSVEAAFLEGYLALLKTRLENL